MVIDEIQNIIVESFIEGKINNAEMVQLIELCGLYLNLQTISEYAKEHKMSYNGVKNHRKIVKIFNVKFVVDNE